MEKYTVRIQKLDEKATLPSYGTDNAAGADLYALTGGEAVTINAHETKFIHTGIAMEIPTGYVGLIYARSGIACKRALAPANKVGVIDSDYRGEIRVGLANISAEDYTVMPGDRIAQMMFVPIIRPQFAVTDSLSETQRGDGGFGHTGSR